MEKSMEQKEQEPSISPKLAIALKIATTATRILLFFFDLWSQQFNLAKAIISVPIAVGIFVMAEATVWYRVSKSENQVEVHLPTTVCSHLWALSNVILCSMTITPDDVVFPSIRSTLLSPSSASASENLSITSSLEYAFIWFYITQS